jgi:protocatechuate 3,4-dioxygenase beta subunit
MLMLGSLRSAAAVLFLSATVFGVVACAQTGTSTIRGRVLDSQFRGIPGARIAVSDENNKLARSQVTDGTGEFSFAGLPPATYRLDAEAPGFKLKS